MSVLHNTLKKRTGCSFRFVLFACCCFVVVVDGRGGGGGWGRIKREDRRKHNRSKERYLS